MDQNSMGESRHIWESLYERAITEADTDLRKHRLQEAEQAILDRARVLDQEPDSHSAEAQALEDAADFIREMKLATQTDGVGKELEIGDKERFPRKPPAQAEAKGRERETKRD